MIQSQNYQRITIKNKNKIELTPYPFKRLQNKIRKYFSFSKKIRLYEEQIPLVLFSNQLVYKNENLDDLCKFININKICKYKHRIKNKNKFSQITKDDSPESSSSLSFSP